MIYPRFSEDDEEISGIRLNNANKSNENIPIYATLVCQTSVREMNTSFTGHFFPNFPLVFSWNYHKHLESQFTCKAFFQVANTWKPILLCFFFGFQDNSCLNL